MAITTLKVLASILQLHGPGATAKSDHLGIDALLSDLQNPDQPAATEVYFRRGGFVRGARAGAFRKGGGYYPGAGAFRRGGFIRGY
jgi:hypothetical protein